MSNAAFFVNQALANGRKPDPQDMDPRTGKARNAFSDLPNGRPSGLTRAQRSTTGTGYTQPTRRGQVPQKLILGADNEQRAKTQDDYEHRNDAFFAAAEAARQNDPNRPHETAAQFKVNQQQRGAPPPAANVGAGGQDSGTSNPNAGKSDATDTPPAPAPARLPGRVATPGSPGVDPVRDSKKLPDVVTPTAAPTSQPLAKPSPPVRPDMMHVPPTIAPGSSGAFAGLTKKKQAVTDDSDDSDNA